MQSALKLDKTTDNQYSGVSSKQIPEIAMTKEWKR
jgi:hypothetical protein